MWGRAPVTFGFALIGVSGLLDQMMTLQYRGRSTAVPVIAYTALDRRGRPLRQTTVHSCFGSTRGDLALTPGENTDLLYFRGADAGLTTDVRAEVVELREQSRRENPVTVVTQTDAEGVELPSGAGFHHVVVTNPGAAEALCRVVAVALDAPESGPQGALEVVSLTPEPVLVPAGSAVVVMPPPDAYAAIGRYFGASFVTVKSHPAAG